jgi:transketolase
VTDVAQLRVAATRIRQYAVDMAEVQGQGYVGQALGVADILAVIYGDQLRFRHDDPEWAERDRFLLSIGHYALALYAALAYAGVIDEAELTTYGSDDSRLPMSGMSPSTPGMEISGGALGHGLGVATGMALGLRLRGNGAHVYNLLSDGELDEGSTWEAALACGHHDLDNLTAIVDVNALQADGATAGVLRTEPLIEKWEAFGWRAERVDGNDVTALVPALERARAHVGGPAVVICDTRVGHGAPILAEREKTHFMRVEQHEWQVVREQIAQGGVA